MHTVGLHLQLVDPADSKPRDREACLYIYWKKKKSQWKGTPTVQTMLFKGPLYVLSDCFLYVCFLYTSFLLFFKKT